MPKTPESLRQEIAKVQKSIKEREKSSLKPTPVSGQVDLFIHPDALPLASVNPAALYEDIVSTYGCVFDDSEIMLPANVPRSEVPVEDLFAMAVKKRKGIQFNAGVLRLEGLSRITTIDKIGWGRQQVSAIVNGSTDEAMFLCKNLCLAIWRANGVERRWEDIAPFCNYVGYESTIHVELPFPLSRLLSSEFRTFLKTDLGSDGKFGKSMRDRELIEEVHKKRLAEMSVVTHCRSINIIVTTFNEVTGEAEDHRLDFLLKARPEANRGLTIVHSELPIDEHVALVERLVEAITSSEGPALAN